VAQGLTGVAQAVLAPAGVVVAAKAAPAATAVLALAVVAVVDAVGAATQEAVEAVEVEDLVNVAHRILLLQTLLLGVADHKCMKIGASEQQLVHAQAP